MIDYEKLKLAHELAEKYSYEINKYVEISIRLGFKDVLPCQIIIDNQSIFYTNIIDDLIEKLQSLVKPEPKYKVGQKVWLISYSDGLVEWEIDGCDMRPGYGYRFGDCHYAENELFPTRKALIEHQLQYWKSLCEHTPELGQLLYKDKYKCGICDTYYDNSRVKQATEKPCDNVGTECQHERDINKPPVPTGSKGYVITEWSAPCLKCGELFVELASTECQHEPEMNFAIDPRPRHIKAKNPKCCKCREFYK